METSAAVMDGLTEAAARPGFIDDLADRLQRTVDRAYSEAGDSAQTIADFLHGTWLGHPLHPALVQLPIGFWTSTMALDLLDSLGARRFRAGSDATLALGIVSALGAAAAGATDWRHVDDTKPRRMGATHAALNSLATLFYAGSLLARMTGRRRAGKSLCMAGMGISTYSAYLGGSMVYDERVGVNHAPEPRGPWDFTPVMRLDDLPEQRPTKTSVQGVDVMLYREGHRVSALVNECAHLGGPLAEGQIKDGCVECPWHGSTYRLADGRVVHGPSAFSQPAYETRVIEGQVELRVRRT